MKIERLYAVDKHGRKIKCKFDISFSENEYKMQITPNETAEIKEAVIYEGEHGFLPTEKFYADGYQKLSQYSGTVVDFECFTDYSDKAHYKMPQTDGYKTVYNYALIGSGKNTTLIGASSCNRFRTEIRINPTKIQLVQCFENIECKANENVKLENIVILRGERNKILSEFADIIGRNHPAPQIDEIPTGWCSWYCIGAEISEKDIFDNLKIIKSKAPQLKYIQIDDGFQPFMGDWLETGDKFEHSMREICNRIKSEGFEPAIWLAPFIASPKSRLLREHPDYFVKDENGTPLCSEKVTFGGWHDGPWYMLDGTNPDACEYIYNTVLEIYHKWNVGYFKLDANVWGALPFGVRYDKNATSVEAYRRVMQAICKATDSNAFILGCNAPMWPSLGLVTGMRVTNDVVRNTEYMSGLSKECFNRNWMHKRLWINDPDCLIMSNANKLSFLPTGITGKLSGKSKFYKYNNIYVRASGGMVLSGDYIGKYSQTELDRLGRILDTDYSPAEFDDNLEVGRKSCPDGIEYYIFNRSNGIKKYEISTGACKRAVDEYLNRELKIKNGKVSFVLPHRGSAWIKIYKY